MRCIVPLFLASVAASGGCSWLVMYSGKDLKEDNREQARLAFGTPVRTGVVDGQPYDDFRTHRKISEVWRDQESGYPMLCTLGLSEVWYFPSELGRAAWLCLKGRDVRYVYDADGKVISPYLDGYRLRYDRDPARPPTSPVECSPEGEHLK